MDTESGFCQEDLERMLNSDLSIPERPGIQFHTRRTPDGIWELVENAEDTPEFFELYLLGFYDQQDWEGLAGVIFPDLELRLAGPGHHFLDGEGNEYFPGWDWELSASRADWGFPEDADWIPYDLDACFAV